MHSDLEVCVKPKRSWYLWHQEGYEEPAHPMHGSRGGGMGSRPPLKNHKAIGFLSNTSPDPLKNHKATKPAANVGPSSARHRNAILMVFRWWTNDGLLLVVFVSSLPSSFKISQIWTPSSKTFWIRASIHIVWKQMMAQSKTSDL